MRNLLDFTGMRNPTLEIVSESSRRHHEDQRRLSLWFGVSYDSMITALLRGEMPDDVVVTPRSDSSSNASVDIVWFSVDDEYQMRPISIASWFVFRSVRIADLAVIKSWHLNHTQVVQHMMSVVDDCSDHVSSHHYLTLCNSARDLHKLIISRFGPNPA